MKRDPTTTEKKQRLPSKGGALFQSKLCRLKDLDGRPFSYRHLLKLVEAGELETIHIGSAHCVTLEQWDRFRTGQVKKTN